LLSPRLPKNIVADKGDHFAWYAPDRTTIKFAYTPQSKPQVEARLNKLLEKIDKVRGSETSAEFLAVGIRNRRDDRPHAVAVRADIKTWDATPKPQNPYDKMLAMHNELHGPPSKSWADHTKEKLERQAEEWEAEQERIQEAEKLHSSKAYQERLAESQERLIVSHYTDVSVSDLKAAEVMYRAAVDGDRQKYKELHEQFASATEARLKAAHQKLVATQQKIAEERASLGKSDFEFQTEPVVIEPVVTEPEPMVINSNQTPNESETL
jgi:hypothetical protein